MTSESINKRLLEFYMGVSPQLENILEPYEDCSSPHLIFVPDGYAAVTARLMIVGQQTNGWENGIFSSDPSGVEAVMRLYADFNLGKKWKRSPFWQAAHKLFRLLNPDGPERSFLWSNLVKVDQNGHRPNADLEEKVCALRILHEEISITKPDVVVFFTGPEYDQRLKKTFPSVRYVPDSRLLAKLKHPEFPALSFRTYHPNYLRRSHKWFVLRKIVEEIPGKKKSVV